LAITLLDGKDLPIKDLNGSEISRTFLMLIGLSDPYVIFRIGNQKCKSKTIQKNLNPVWNENMMLHCSLADTLHVEVGILSILIDFKGWDEDRLSSDDKVRPL
jgi:Ca2+-dependent lipid-binding protein